MPTPWVAWKRILSCKQDSHLAVHDPKASITTNITTIPNSTRKPVSSKVVNPPHNKGNGVHPAKKRRSTGSAVCCNDLKNVIHGNTRVVHRADHESPLYNHNSPQQLKVLIQTKEPTFLISPLPEPSFHQLCSYKAVHLKKLSGCYDCSIASCEPPDFLLSHTTANHHSLARHSVCCYPPSTCHKCGESLDKPEALEEHHATYHSVTELRDGDSARSIVEIIFQTSWLRQDIPCAKPERIFKVHNSSKTVAKFEEYRDMVKAKASKISKKHSRCLVDGNELLRFYSTTISCHMGKTRSSLSSLSSSSSSSSLCTSSSCGVCHILRHGFPTKGQPGIYTNASSGKAHDSMLFGKEFDGGAEAKQAMLVCRVIAGRVKKMGLESSQDGSLSGYDSVTGESGQYTDLEELLVFNTRAVLPCFIVIYSC